MRQIFLKKVFFASLALSGTLFFYSQASFASPWASKEENAHVGDSVTALNINQLKVKINQVAAACGPSCNSAVITFPDVNPGNLISRTEFNALVTAVNEIYSAKGLLPLHSVSQASGSTLIRGSDIQDLREDLDDPRLSTCGNSAVDSGEQCDGGAGCSNCICSGGFTPFNPAQLGCSSNCNGLAIDPGEQCDGTHLGGNDCTTIAQGFTGGTLGCSSCSFQTSFCTGSSGSCDNNGSCDSGEDNVSCPADCPADTCANGVGSCSGGRTCCDDGCDETDTDLANCGSCGNSCDSGKDCVGGGCVPPCGQNQYRDQNGVCQDFSAGCTPPSVDCGSGCVDTGSDNDHCGSCQARCTVICGS